LVLNSEIKNRPEISFVLPAYNEEDNISLVIKKVDDAAKRLELKYELIVVDDGSNDSTRIKVNEFAKDNEHVKVVGYSNNVGKGFALKTGFSHAAGNMVIFMDSDMDIEPEQIHSYVETLKYKDIVIGSKWHPQSIVDAPLIRKILSHGFNILVKLLLGLELSDTQAGLKAIRRSAFMRVFPLLSVKRYAFDVELLVVANLLGLRFAELPIRICQRSLFGSRGIWEMFIELLGITYRLRVIRWYQRAIRAKILFK